MLAIARIPKRRLRMYRNRRIHRLQEAVDPLTGIRCAIAQASETSKTGLLKSLRCGRADRPIVDIETHHSRIREIRIRYHCRQIQLEQSFCDLRKPFCDQAARTQIAQEIDQFPTDIYLTTQVMLVVLEMGGFTTGGLNFDAKRRRESHEPIDLIHAHIGGMDAFARGLKIAHAIRQDGRLGDFVKARYSSFDQDIGAKIEAGEVGFEELEKFALSNGEPTLGSGRQEMLENLLNEFI